MSNQRATNGATSHADFPPTLAAPPVGDSFGLQFLAQLESKHDQVLEELDSLNARIEQVLLHYAASRHSPSSQSADGRAPSSPTQAGGQSAPASVAGKFQPPLESDPSQRRAA